MKSSACCLYIVLLAFPVLAPAEQAEQTDPLMELDWKLGPTVGEIDGRASIEVPEGYGFLGTGDTDRFLELTQNLPTGRDHLFIPLSFDWNAFFSFDEIGYVEDNEALDADAILESLKQGNEAANAERRKRGWAEMNISGWHTRPRYDETTNRLEWAVLATTQGHEVVNYNTRFLGRKGVMEVTLVSSPEQLDAAIADFNALATAFSFDEGERYAEYRDGDQLAGYGLAALVAGGAAAVAAKGGAKFGKAILLAVIAGAAGLWAVVKRVVARG